MHRRIKKGVRKKAFYSPWVKKEHDSYNPVVFYSVLSISKKQCERQEIRFSMDLCLFDI